MKKAQGLPLTTIVIALLALIVMVIIVAFLMRGAGKFSKGIEDCNAKKGDCIGKGDSCTGFVIPIACPEGKVCCVKEEKIT